MAAIERALISVSDKRNVVEFANTDGTYDDLAKYLRSRKFR